MRLPFLLPLLGLLFAIGGAAFGSGAPESNLTYFGASRFSIQGVLPVFDIAESYIRSQTDGSTKAITSTGEGGCSAKEPCILGSCCNSDGQCGYRTEHCSPSAPKTCVANCDAKAPCGEFSVDGKTSCPLNVCCSHIGFCGTSDVFCRGTAPTAGDALVAVNAPSCGKGSGSASRRVAYYQSWNTRRRNCDKALPYQLDLTGITHLVLAFATIDPTTFQVRLMNPADEDIYKQFMTLPNTVSKWIGVGGFEFNDPGATQHTFSDMASKQENRKAFVDSLKQFCSKWNFKGVDIDWEWPGHESRGGRDHDGANQVELMKEMRQAFGKDFGLGVAIPAQYDYMKNMDIKGLEAHVDWLSMLTYDLHGPWDKDVPGLGPKLRPHTDLKEIDNALNPLWSSNIDSKKVNMGIANYGRGYTVADKNCMYYGCAFTGPSKAGSCSLQDGVLSTCEIRRLINEKHVTWKVIAGGAEVNEVSWDDQWIAFDDAGTFGKKLELANDRCLGGTALWAIDYAVCPSDGGSPQPGPGSSVAPSKSASAPASSVASSQGPWPVPSQTSWSASSNVPGTSQGSSAAPSSAASSAKSSAAATSSPAVSSTHSSAQGSSQAPTSGSAAPSWAPAPSSGSSAAPSSLSSAAPSSKSQGSSGLPPLQGSSATQTSAASSAQGSPTSSGAPASSSAPASSNAPLPLPSSGPSSAWTSPQGSSSGQASSSGQSGSSGGWSSSNAASPTSSGAWSSSAGAPWAPGSSWAPSGTSQASSSGQGTPSQSTSQGGSSGAPWSTAWSSSGSSSGASQTSATSTQAQSSGQVIGSTSQAASTGSSQAGSTAASSQASSVAASSQAGSTPGSSQAGSTGATTTVGSSSQGGSASSGATSATSGTSTAADTSAQSSAQSMITPTTSGSPTSTDSSSVVASTSSSVPSRHWCPIECLGRNWCKVLCGIEINWPPPRECWEFEWCMLWFGFPTVKGEKDKDGKPKCKLLGCGCGWMGLPWGPGCQGGSLNFPFPLNIVIELVGLFPDPCFFWGCKGTCGVLGCDGWCFGPGCLECPKLLCPGGGPKPGPPPSPFPPIKPPGPTEGDGKPKACEPKDYKTATERFVYCGDFVYLSSAISATTISTWTSTTVTTSTSSSSTCHTPLEVTVIGCYVSDVLSTTTTSATKSNSLSSETPGPACTRAPLSLDDDEGNNIPLEWESSSSRFGSNTTAISTPSSTMSSASPTPSADCSKCWEYFDKTCIPSRCKPDDPVFCAYRCLSDMCLAPNSPEQCWKSHACAHNACPSDVMAAPQANATLTLTYTNGQKSTVTMTSGSSLSTSTSSTPTITKTFEVGTSSTSVEVGTSEVAKPSPGPMNQKGEWRVNIHLWMENKSAKIEWELYDPNKNWAGQGKMYPKEGNEPIYTYIESDKGRASEHSMLFGVKAWFNEPIKINDAVVELEIQKAVPNCDKIQNVPCKPKMVTENSLETKAFFVDSCYQYCSKDRPQDQLLKPSDLGCDDLNDANWEQSGNGWVRNFNCYWKGF